MSPDRIDEEAEGRRDVTINVPAADAGAEAPNLGEGEEEPEDEDGE